MKGATSPLRSRLGNALVLLLLAALAAWLLRLQAAPWPALTPLPKPRLFAALALLAWLAFSGWIAWRSRAPRAAMPEAGGDGDSWWVVHASQTGYALELAQRTVQTLREAGCAALACDIARLDPHRLQGARCLFVASTTGEGDPPDAALGFAGTIMAAALDLRDTRYAVLALGDRSYAQFCAFGHRLDAWLRGNGAQPLFDLVEVDNADPGALRHWQGQLGVLTGHTGQPDWARPQYQRWTLAARELLNPGSAGGPAFHLALAAPDATPPSWQAGDIAEIGPRNPASAVAACLAGGALDGRSEVHWQDERLPLAEALARSRLPAAEALRGCDAQAVAALLQPLPHREYSIASLPADGHLELLVRLMRREDGEPGLGSGWLCLHAAVGEGIDLRIRGNPNFHPPQPAQPLILIGNGTGIAGLRAHLKARIAQGAGRNWLLFGERHAAHDAFFDDELHDWQRAGHISHLDRVYSRDGGAHRYVQDALRAQGERLRQWLDEGAALYVCGSLEGMAPGVDAVLREALGAARVDALLAAGRYRRDVY